MIRKATPNDFESILDLSAKFWRHTQYSEPFEREHTLLMVQQAYSHGLLAVLEIKGEIVGFAAGVKSFLLGSTQALTGTELAWWVNEDHRHGRNGIGLLRFIEGLARDQGIKYWNMASMESCEPEVANNLYERMGYCRSENVYTKVL